MHRDVYLGAFLLHVKFDGSKGVFDMSKKKRRRRAPSLYVKDRHHLCFQGRHWSHGYAKLLRNAFVRPIPVVYHRELHELLHDVPLPDGALLKEAWIKYCDDRDEIDSYGVCRALAWLYVNVPDVEFRKAIQFQLDFFTERLGGS